MFREFIDTIKISRKASKAIKLLKYMDFDSDKIDGDIKKTWYSYREIVGNNLLNKMSIERLNDVEGGMPIRTLEKNGLNFIGDCNNKSEQYFERFPGIGKVKSERIVSAVNSLKSSVFDELDFKIIKNSKSEDLLKVLNKRMKYNENEEEIIEFNKNKNDLIEEFKRNISLANKKKFILPWLFNNDKESIDNAIKELSQLDISDLTNKYEYLTKIDKNISFYDDFNKNSAAYYAALEKALNLKLDFKNIYLSDDLIKKVESTKLNTDELIVSPRAYQYFGAQYIISQEKTLIGDEMGLGKTIEALIAMNHLSQEDGAKYFVVIAPLSVITNWKRETEKWTVFTPYVFHGNKRMEIFTLWLESGGVLITTYGHANFFDLNKQSKIDMLVVDEAHYVKNPKTQRSKAVYAIGEKAEYITYMSGTPLENKIEEMIQLISILQKPIADNLNRNLTKFNLRPKAFRKKIAPVYLRRNREDVLSELPDLEEVEYWLPFGEIELIHYKEGIKEGNFMKMRRSAWTGGSINKSPKLNALVDICEQAKNEGHKVLVFSFFRDVISVVDSILKDRSYGPISGDVNNIKRQEMIDNFDKAEPGSVLISQIMAGGVGLNIQSANIIILCEPQYKPSTEEQAISRSYRMGQNKDVIVYRLLTEKSVDERILSIIHGKKQVFNNFAKDSEVADQSSSAVDSSDKNIIDKIVQLEAERYGLINNATLSFILVLIYM